VPYKSLIYNTFPLINPKLRNFLETGGCLHKGFKTGTPGIFLKQVGAYTKGLRQALLQILSNSLSKTWKLSWQNCFFIVEGLDI